MSTRSAYENFPTFIRTELKCFIAANNYYYKILISIFYQHTQNKFLIHRLEVAATTPPGSPSYLEEKEEDEQLYIVFHEAPHSPDPSPLTSCYYSK